MLKVALRKESVDRNYELVTPHGVIVLSLSARRAWIEMILGTAIVTILIGRSPQGERG